MSAEVIKDTVGQDGETRYLEFDVPVADFCWLYAITRKAHQLWIPRIYATYGPSIMDLEGALEERFILKAEDFRPSLEGLGGAVDLRAFDRDIDNLSMLLAAEGHSSGGWIGYMYLKSTVETKSIQLTPTIPNKLKASMPVEWALEYSGEEVYEEIAAAAATFVEAA